MWRVCARGSLVVISFPLSSVYAGIWVSVQFKWGAFVAAITLIDTEKAQMHTAVIIGHRLIF